MAHACPVTVFALKRIDSGSELAVAISCQVPFEVDRMVIKTRYNTIITAADETQVPFCFEVYCDELGRPVSQVIKNSSESTSNVYFSNPTVVRGNLTFRLRLPASASSLPSNANSVATPSYLGYELTFYPADKRMQV
jgi:hypothetical protein